MSWIDVIEPSDADGELANNYRKVAGPGGQVDNVLKSHSLRPHTLIGHMALYKAVLHHRDNKLPTSLLEMIGVRVSILNQCDYCVEHHKAGLRKQIGDDRFAKISAALDSGDTESLDARERTALTYAEQLTREPASVGVVDIEILRGAGFSDGEILEINQVAAYFAYANRTVLGLGTSHVGEELGHAPSSNDPDEWEHR